MQKNIQPNIKLDKSYWNRVICYFALILSLGVSFFLSEGNVPALLLIINIHSWRINSFFIPSPWSRM